MEFIDFVDEYLYRSEYFTTFELLKTTEELLIIFDIKNRKGEVKND